MGFTNKYLSADLQRPCPSPSLEHLMALGKGPSQTGLKAQPRHRVSVDLLTCRTPLITQLFFRKMEIIAISLSCRLNKIMNVDGPAHGMGSAPCVHPLRPSISTPLGLQKQSTTNREPYNKRNSFVHHPGGNKFKTEVSAGSGSQ